MTLDMDAADRLTLDQVAALIGIGAASVRDLVRRGELPQPVARSRHRVQMFERSEIYAAVQRIRDREDDWVSTAGAGALLGWSYYSVLRRAHAGKGPPYHPEGPPSRKFKRSEVLAYLERQDRAGR